MQKRKAYIGIKRVLKEKKIRFQTPLTKLQVHWSNGVKTYDSAMEAARDMRERCYIVDPPGDDSAPATTGKTQQIPGWQRLKGKEMRREAAHCARERLQEFHRKI